MGQQIHIEVAELLRTCKCRLLTEVVGEECERMYFIAAESPSLEVKTFSLGSEANIIASLAEGGKQCWADCNSWGSGLETLAWASKLGIAFQVY